MEAAPAYSRRLVTLIADLREAFSGFADAFQGLAARRAHFAPAFMRTYETWHRETGRPFVAFVQELDPTLPAERARYMRHRSWQAACYLRRLAEAPETRAGRGRTSATPLDVLASVIRSVQPLLGPDADYAFDAIVRVAGWHQRDVDRLRARVRHARRIALRPDAPRLVREPRVHAGVLRHAETPRHHVTH